MDQVPGHLIVIGGGYVGLELSQAMRRFGSKVTVIDRNDRLLSREDDDVTKAIADLFRDEGIDAILNARVKRVSGKSGDSVTVVVEQDGKGRDARRHSSPCRNGTTAKHGEHRTGIGRD